MNRSESSLPDRLPSLTAPLLASEISENVKIRLRAFVVPDIAVKQETDSCIKTQDFSNSYDEENNSIPFQNPIQKCEGFGYKL